MGESTLVYVTPVASVEEALWSENERLESASLSDGRESEDAVDSVESMPVCVAKERCDDDGADVDGRRRGGGELRRESVLKMLRSRGVEITHLPASMSSSEVARRFISQCGVSQSFFVVNVARVYDQLALWKAQLPKVAPFYAVKCNPDVHFLHALGELGCNFDCASLAEMRSVLNMGVRPGRIVFANPCKKLAHLRWARNHGVRKMTFDNEPELDKIKAIFPSAELILRIATDDSSSVCRFSMKFGLPPGRAREVLSMAQQLQLNVIGVSFHVGSGCTDARLYELAIADARRVFDVADGLGLRKLRVLDIGGGFAGEVGSQMFLDTAAQIRRSLEAHFPRDGYGRDVDVIAEPGRFFALSTHRLLTCVYARRESHGGGGDGGHQTYYVDDGVYGSFNSILYDHARPMPQPLRVATAAAATGGDGGRRRDEHGDGEPEGTTKKKRREQGQPMAAPAAEAEIDHSELLCPTTIFGPTCDGLDNLTPHNDVWLPKLDVGDFVLWEDMGAYTCAATGYNFNGMEAPLKYYVFQ